MVPSINAAALLALGFLAPLAQAEIDFTPVPTQTLFEGAPFPQTSFRDGPSTVIYQPPPGWTMQGQGPRLTLHPAKISLASAAIESRPRPADSSLDGVALQKLQAEIAATLPREAENIAWGAPEVNPLLLNRHETRRLSVTYSAYAQRFTVTVIVCNFEQEQLRFRLDTRTDDFEKQYDLFRRSLYSWQGLP